MKGKTVLEIGLGSGSNLGLEAKYAKKIYGIDISDETIELNQKRKEYYHLDNLELICESATKLPLKDHSVDVVISIGCIHHIPDAEKVIKEISRVLKPGGIFKGMVYYKNSYRCKYYIPRLRKTQKYWRGKTYQECINELYDGKGNPYAKVYSKIEIKTLLSDYKNVNLKIFNFAPWELALSKTLFLIPRNFWLATIGRIVGTDLYFSARKKN
jgi:ubiquinone/menaquinone biosynthesis C-methylase UbiE